MMMIESNKLTFLLLVVAAVGGVDGAIRHLPRLKGEMEEAEESTINTIGRTGGRRRTQRQSQTQRRADSKKGKGGKVRVVMSAVLSIIPIKRRLCKVLPMKV